MNERQTEAARQIRLIDQMTSSYSKLRDENARWASILLAFQLVGGLIVVALAFAPAVVEEALSLSTGDASHVVAAAGAVLFLASLFDLAFDPRGKAAAYGLSADRFAELKLRHRDIASRVPTTEESAQLRSDYEFACRTSLKIPERDFLRLKLHHRRKVLLSRMIDSSPTTPLWMLKLLAMFGRANVDLDK